MKIVRCTTLLLGGFVALFCMHGKAARLTASGAYPHHKPFVSNVCSPQKSVLVVVGTFPKVSQTFVLKHIMFLIDNGYDVAIYPMRKMLPRVQSQEIDAYGLYDRVVQRIDRIRVEKYDAILCQFSTLAHKMLSRNLVPENTKLAVCFRGFDVSEMIQKYPEGLKKVFERADLILPVSDHFRTILLSHSCQPEKIVVLHSSVDCEKFAFCLRSIPQDGSSIRILTVGRLTEKKGHSDAIRAVAQLVEKYPNLTYEIIGDGPDKQMVQSLIEELGMHDYVTLLGALPHEEVRTHLEKAHIFLLASKIARNGDEEGIPNVISEAMASGVPVVSTYHGGIPETIEHSVTGLLAPEGDVSKLAQNIEYYVCNPEHARKCAVAARQRVLELFSSKKVRAEMKLLLSQLLGSRKDVE